MKKVYFFAIFICLITGSVRANNINKLVEDCCAHSPELYQEVMCIIDDTTKTSEEKVAQLCMLQKAARADLEEKILECVDIYTDVGLQLQTITKGFMVIDEIKDHPPISISMSTDVFKKRLLSALKRLDASAAVILAFAVSAGTGQDDIPIFNVEEKSFFQKCVSIVFQKKSLVGALGVSLLALYGVYCKNIFSLKHKALNETPLSEWFDSIDSLYKGGRLQLLYKVATDFSQQGDFSELYESIDGRVHVYTSAVDAFLIAAKKEEEILRGYTSLLAWAETFFISWLLPVSKQETNRIKRKLEHIVTMQEII